MNTYALYHIPLCTSGDNIVNFTHNSIRSGSKLEYLGHFGYLEPLKGRFDHIAGILGLNSSLDSDVYCIF